MNLELYGNKPVQLSIYKTLRKLMFRPYYYATVGMDWELHKDLKKRGMLQ